MSGVTEAPELGHDVTDRSNPGGGKARPRFQNAPEIWNRRKGSYVGPAPFGLPELEKFDVGSVEVLGPGRLKQRFIRLSREFHSSMADRYPDELAACSAALAQAEAAIAAVKAHRKWIAHRGAPVGARGIGRWTQQECHQFLGEMEAGGHIRKDAYTMKTSIARLRKLCREAAERANLNPDQLKKA